MATLLFFFFTPTFVVAVFLRNDSFHFTFVLKFLCKKEEWSDTHTHTQKMLNHL